MSDTDCLPTIDQALEQDGYARLAGADLLRQRDISAADWAPFARSWDDLGPDLFMADGGRYRRRRHATFHCAAGQFSRQPHQPHYQSRDYNPLNGDVQRWFDPVEDATIALPVTQALLAFCASHFDPASSGDWHVEMHQFRIEAKPGELGRPTPEGMHRDGVDYVLVLLIDRRQRMSCQPVPDFLHRPRDPVEPPHLAAQPEDAPDGRWLGEGVDRPLLDRLDRFFQPLHNRLIAIDHEIEDRVGDIVRPFGQPLRIAFQPLAQMCRAFGAEGYFGHVERHGCYLGS